RNLRCSCAVEVELNVNIRFRGGALHGRFPARDQFSSHRDGDTPYSACTGAAYYCTRTLFVRLISSANYVPQRNQKRRGFLLRSCGDAQVMRNAHAADEHTVAK